MGANIIADKINKQTNQIQISLCELESSLKNSIYSSADLINNSIKDLQSSLINECIEIKWQLSQQNETLDKIFLVLQENRSNEARQLVSQGIRLYLNEKYDKAEERFLKALDYDMTDYQVLMNLGFIELNKGDSDISIAYFRDALILPERLDSESKAITLKTIARVYYSLSNYKQALLYSEEAFKVYAELNSNQNDYNQYLIDIIIYATLLGNVEYALTKLSDRSICQLALNFSELELIREQIIIKLIGFYEMTGIFTDKSTGLMWQRFSVGQTWDGEACVGSPTVMSWYDAIKLVSNFAGYSDWRLPTKEELMAIMSVSNNWKGTYWSSSPNANVSSSAWVVNFDYGDSGDYYKGNDNFVRLVR
jgi:tetratricopeptide (TPR) repeat protein